MSNPLISLLADPLLLSIIKGQGVEPFWTGVEKAGLIDTQDVGTCVEFTEIMISKFYPRTLAKGAASG